jgi:hypothetical protein
MSESEGDHSVRVVGIYATKWRHRGEISDRSGAGSSDHRLTSFYGFFRGQLPRLPGVLWHGPIPAHRVAFRDLPGVELALAESWVFVLPSDQVVAAVTLNFSRLTLDDQSDVVAMVLDRCTYDGLTIDRLDLEDYVSRVISGLTGLEEYVASYAGKDDQLAREFRPVLLPERHHIVFAQRQLGFLPNEEVVERIMYRAFAQGQQSAIPHEAVVERILYRSMAPYTVEFSQRVDPAELNPKDSRGEAEDALGIVTTHVSLFYGQDPLVEDSVFLSTVQAVGTASRFRQIWDEAYHWVRVFRSKDQKQGVGEQKRQDLEELVDRLGNLEFDLTFSVEFPLMRIESFHSALSKVLDLENQAETLSQMFTQLEGSVKSEITAIDIRDREAAELKQRQNANAAMVISLIGVPVTFILAFFGVNATQVKQEWSMFDRHYVVIYLVAAVLGLIPITIIAISRLLTGRSLPELLRSTPKVVVRTFRRVRQTLLPWARRSGRGRGAGGVSHSRRPSRDAGQRSTMPPTASSDLR